VHAGHEDGAGGGADGIAGVVAGEADAILGEAVEVGSAELGLPVTGEITKAEVSARM
jgi:hypothetical protein